MTTDRAASVLARLKNKARECGISYQQCLQLFFQEEFLRKLSASHYKDNLILKGWLFIYTLTNYESRATVDVDFMLRGSSNDMARMDEIIAEILATLFYSYGKVIDICNYLNLNFGFPATPHIICLSYMPHKFTRWKNLREME